MLQTELLWVEARDGIDFIEVIRLQYQCLHILIASCYQSCDEISSPSTLRLSRVQKVSDASSVPLCYATINIAEKGYQNVPVHPSSTATIAILCGVGQCSPTGANLSITLQHVKQRLVTVVANTTYYAEHDFKKTVADPD
eukprot:scpid62645/ scgid4299/ 